MTITLITGGNKGLGYEAARRLSEIGHRVYLAARDESRGKAAAEAIGAQFVRLDVTDDRSVDAAATEVGEREGRVDVLINNAGIIGGGAASAETTVEDVRLVFETNVFGIVRVTHAFLPLLRKSSAPTIVNVSSGLGSFGVVNDPGRMESERTFLAYSSSKAAVSMLTVQYAKAFPEFRINVVDPGYTATDLNGHRGTQTVDQGAAIIVRMAQLGLDGPTGTYADVHGTVPW